MADNVAITAGAGTTIRTDDVGSGVQVQYVKLMNAADAATDLMGFGFKDHDAPNGAGNNPLVAGYEAIAHGTNPTAVAAADVTKGYANRAGIPFVMGGHPNIVTTRTQFTTAQTDASLVGTINAGTKVVVTGFQVTLDNASTVFPSVRIGFGATNTPTGTGVIGAHGGLPAGGGFGRGDGSGIIGIGADGEELRITTVGTATGNGVEVVVTYYTIES